MRQKKGFNHLSRKAPHRKAMLANMACSLIQHKRINTTVAKAKALRMYVEPLITKSKNDSTHSRRVVFSYLKDKYAVAELFRDVAVKIGERPGGYTRILKTGNRLGDNAEMCLIELVDYNESMMQDAAPKAKKRTRRGKAKADETPVAEMDYLSGSTDAGVEDAQIIADDATPDASTEVKGEAPAEEATPEAPAAGKAAPEAEAAPEAKAEAAPETSAEDGDSKDDAAADETESK